MAASTKNNGPWEGIDEFPKNKNGSPEGAAAPGWEPSSKHRVLEGRLADVQPLNLFTARGLHLDHVVAGLQTGDIELLGARDGAGEDLLAVHVADQHLVVAGERRGRPG